MRPLEKSILYWNTIKRLRYSQILYRLYYMVRPRLYKKNFPSFLATSKGSWIPTKNNNIKQLDDKKNILLLGVKGKATQWIPKDKEQLWIYHLHYFDYAADDLQSKDISIIRSIIDNWIEENKVGIGPGWEPYPLSLRIVNWIKFALNGHNISTAMVESLGLQTWFLNRNIEYHLLGNHLFRNAKALCFAGSFLKTQYSQKWLNKGINIIIKELEEQVLDDGGNFELSPMYHSNMIEDILDLINLHNHYPDTQLSNLIEELSKKVSKMLTWLTFMTHPDGEIAFFNDTALNMSLNLSELKEYALKLGIEGQHREFNGTTHLKDSGYGIVSSEHFKLICDIGKIGPDYMPGHGHADVLSFELSINNERVFVNSGTSIYGLSNERLEQRKTKAHNTVEVDRVDSSEVWNGFRVAKRAYPNNICVEENCIRASHSGYQRLKGDVIHNREWKVSDLSIKIIDKISGKFNIATAYYHVHPQITVIKKDSSTYELNHANGKSYEFRISGGISKLINSFWYPEFGTSIPNKTFQIDIKNRELISSITIL